MKKICTVGSATHDIFMMYEGAETMRLHQKKSSCSYLLLEQGAKIDIPSIHTATGGGATNVAVGLSRLGFSVETFFKTGHDEAETFIKKELAHEKVSTTYCTVADKERTALTIIIPSREHDHVALCYRAANRQQNKEDFPLSLLNSIDLLFLGPLNGQSQQLFPYLAQHVKNAGVTLAMNPSVEQLNDASDDFIQALRSVDILILNKRESGYLMKALLKETRQPQFSSEQVKKPSLFSPYLAFDDLLFTLRDVIKKTLALGPQILVFTNGSEGVYVVTETTIYFHESIPSFPLYSLGAGDAFSSGFIGGLLKDLTLQEALRLGVLNAASVIQYPDAKKGLLSFDRLEESANRLNKTLLSEYSL